jgi:hypothetical protein
MLSTGITATLSGSSPRRENEKAHRLDTVANSNTQKKFVLADTVPRRRAFVFSPSVWVLTLAK